MHASTPPHTHPAHTHPLAAHAAASHRGARLCCGLRHGEVRRRRWRAAHSRAAPMGGGALQRRLGRAMRQAAPPLQIHVGSLLLAPPAPPPPAPLPPHTPCATWPVSRVDLVMVGAEAVAESGGIVNKLGTYTIALAAKAHAVPFYAAAESYKFARRAWGEGGGGRAAQAGPCGALYAAAESHKLGRLARVCVRAPSPTHALPHAPPPLRTPPTNTPHAGSTPSPSATSPWNASSWTLGRSCLQPREWTTPPATTPHPTSSLCCLQTWGSLLQPQSATSSSSCTREQPPAPPLRCV